MHGRGVHRLLSVTRRYFPVAPNRRSHDRAVVQPGAAPRSGGVMTVKAPITIPKAREDIELKVLAVRAVELTKVYGEESAQVVALDNVSVDFARTQFTAIMGPSGSGKSTLLHCLAGLDSPTSGTVWLGDTEITSLNDRELTLLRRDRVGFIFQAFNLLPTLTAAQNITLPLDIAGRKADKAWAKQVIDAVDLADRLHHRPAQLSGGQQQRVAAARALTTRPDVIFADEP